MNVSFKSMDEIIWVDVMSDNTEELMGEYRQTNVLPSHTNKITTLLIKSDAVKTELRNALSAQIGGFLTCSAHGERNRLNSFQGRHLFNTNEEYGDIQDKIIHLKACLTASKLGPGLVREGAKAFYGYEDLISFPSKEKFPHLIPYFMEPDEILVNEVSTGQTAKEVHREVIAKYDENIGKLKNMQAPQSYIVLMEMNRDAFRSPEKSTIYGDKSAQLNTFV